MPLQWAHSLFFAGDGAGPGPGVVYTYPFWGVAAHSTTSSFGVLDFEIRRRPRPSGPQPRGFWSRQWKNVKRLWKEIGRKMPERAWVAFQLARLAFSPTYSAAQVAVRRVAVSGAPRGLDLGPYMTQRAIVYGHGENMYRRFEAEDLLGFALAERQARSPQVHQNVALEAAYLALRERGK